jgi:hypothetical protein
MTADLKTVNLPRILLLASPDDFLLELERRVAVDTWQSANPQGEIVSFDQAPSATRVVQELASPSLFASDRLIVISDASVCFTAGRRSDAEDLARGLTSLPLAGVTLLLSAVSSSAPKGALAEAVAGRGEVRFLPLPEPPKPWEEGRVSRPQRQTLMGLVARVAPTLACNDEVVDALCEVYGFRPRELAQAAERLALAGEATAAAVRAQAGAGERQLRDLEEALQQHDVARLTPVRRSPIGAATRWRPTASAECWPRQSDACSDKLWRCAGMPRASVLPVNSTQNAAGGRTGIRALSSRGSWRLSRRTSKRRPIRPSWG